MKIQVNFISKVHTSIRQLTKVGKKPIVYKELLQLSLALRLVKQGAKATKCSSSEIVVASFMIIKPEVPEFPSQGMFHLFLSIWLD